MRRLALAVVAVLLVPAAAGAARDTTREVRVTDAAVAPVEARIAVGDAVRWRNAGSRTHAVVSDTGAWPPVVLRPGQARTTTFRKAGCFRYRVDGRVRGRVAVSASCGAGSGTGGGASPGQSTYRYDVTVTGAAHTTQRHSGDEPGIYDRNGTVDVRLTWRSTFRDVALKKVSSAGSFVIANAGGLFGRGTTNVVFTYDHRRQNGLGPCAGSFTLGELASRVRAGGTGAAAATGGSTFTFGAQLLPGPAAALGRRIQGACEYSDEPRWVEFQGSPEPDVVRNGLTWSDVDPITLLSVDVERRAPRSFFPLDRLATGAGFTIRTGTIRVEGRCQFGSLARECVERFEGSLTVTFVPRRS